MDNSTVLEVIEVDPIAPHKGSIIWLHGLGADGSDFLGLIGMLGLPEDHGLRFIFPSAPIRPITINNGMEMRGWFDILDLHFNVREDEAGIELASGWLEDLVQRELMLNSCSSKNVLVAGFSQGGAVVLHNFTRSALPLAGAIVLSSYQPMPDKYKKPMAEVAEDTPVFMSHGLFDPIVPYHHGESAKKKLEDSGFDVQWHSYPIQHSVSDEEIEDIGNFISTVFSVEKA